MALPPNTPPEIAAPRTAPATRSRPARHGLAGAVVAALVGSALTATASTQTWLTDSGTAAAPGGRASGSAVAPLVLATGLVGLAAAGALLATAGVVRRILGVVVTLLAAGALASTGTVLARPAATYRGSAMPGFAAAAGAVSLTAWPFLALLGLLLLGAVGVATAAAGGRWPVLGRRYQAPGAGGPPVRSTGPAADWDDLDAGRDPTLVDPDPPGADPDPGVARDSVAAGSTGQQAPAPPAPTGTEQRWRSATRTVTPRPGGRRP